MLPFGEIGERIQLEANIFWGRKDEFAHTLKNMGFLKTAHHGERLLRLWLTNRLSLP